MTEDLKKLETLQAYPPGYINDSDNVRPHDQPIKTGVAIPGQPSSASPEGKEKITPDIEPKTGAENSNIVSQPPGQPEDYKTDDRSCVTKITGEEIPREQPNKNSMVFEQIDGCCDIIEKLLNELIPRTEKVDGCIYKLKEWRNDYLRILRQAFE